MHKLVILLTLTCLAGCSSEIPGEPHPEVTEPSPPTLTGGRFEVGNPALRGGRFVVKEVRP